MDGLAKGEKMFDSHILAAIIAMITVSCSTPQTLRINSDELTKIDLVDTKNPDRILKKIGNTPSEIKLSDLQNKMIKLTRPGKLPQFVYPFELAQGKNEIQVKLRPINSVPEVQAKADTQVDANILHNMLLDAYEAVNISSDLAKAETIADEMIKLDETLAAPRLIKALVFLQKGDTNNARIQAKLAKSLDPSNSRVDLFLRSLQDGL